MSSRVNNILALDGIRGLAIILVMLHHFEGRLPASNYVLRSAKGVFSFGWVGVDLFFALSGFLITGILLDTRKANNYFGAFYARRVLRIFPLYYSVLIVILIAASLIHPRPQNVPLVADQKLYFFYLTNWLVLWKGTWGANILGHFWSLAVEEQFYFAWPLCVWLLTSRNLARLAITASIIALLVRIFWIAHPGSDQAIAMATVTRMDSLLCGALGAILIRDDQTLNSVRKWLPGIAMIVILCFVGGVGWFRIVRGHRGHFLFIGTLGYSFLALGFSALIVYSAATDGIPNLLQRLLRSRVLTVFGKYSYGIYVYHVPISGVLNYLLYERLFKSVASSFWFGALYVAFLFATSFLVAKISYEYFERYFLGLKRYFKARTETAPRLTAEIAQ